MWNGRPGAKRRRRQILAETGMLGINPARLSGLLDTIKNLDPEDQELIFEGGSSRHVLSRDALALTEHLVERVVLPASSGSDVPIYFSSVTKVWAAILEDYSSGYAQLLRQLPRSTADRPWNLVVYGDEAVPGNVMNPDNARKVFAISFAVREFGPEVLCHVTAWMPWLMVRTTEHKRITGGMSAALRAVLRHHFVTLKAHRGIACGKLGTVYLQLSNVVMDGDAMHVMFHIFASKALLPCTCLNVFQGGARGILKIIKARFLKAFLKQHCLLEYSSKQHCLEASASGAPPPRRAHSRSLRAILMAPTIAEDVARLGRGMGWSEILRAP